jgi:hypothetical protein
VDLVLVYAAGEGHAALGGYSEQPGHGWEARAPRLDAGR